MKTYSELIKMPTYEERLNYLRITKPVAEETFGGHRYLNQMLYRSPEWKQVRNKVIIRDEGCDLGIEERPINSKLLIHHIEPITIDDILNRDPKIFDLNNLITVSNNTHQLIHYGGDDVERAQPNVRTKNDTKLW